MTAAALAGAAYVIWTRPRLRRLAGLVLKAAVTTALPMYLAERRGRARRDDIDAVPGPIAAKLS